MRGSIETSRQDAIDEHEEPWEAEVPLWEDREEVSPEPAGTLHVVPCEGGWGIRVGTEDVERLFRSREDAVRNARRWAMREDRFVFLHAESGPTPG